MIAFLSICYAGFYWLFFVKLGLFPRTPRNISIFAAFGTVLIGAIAYAWLAVSPTSKDGRMFQYVIPIVPSVSGNVVEVPVEALVPVAAGDVLYRIDPVPFQATVDRLEAEIVEARAVEKRARIQYERERELAKSGAGAQEEVDRWTEQLATSQASIASLQAQLTHARWELDESVVRAPHSGYVFSLQLRPGGFVQSASSAAELAFVSDERRVVLASFSDSALRLAEAGDRAEVVFRSVPGRVFSGKIESLARASGAAQIDASGVLPTLVGTPADTRYAALISLDEDDPDLLPQGAAASVALYTGYGKPFHVISKVFMRMQGWLGYLTST